MAGGGWRLPFWWVLRRHAPDPKPRVVLFDVPYGGGAREEGVTELSGWGLRVTRQGHSHPPELFEEMAGRHKPYPAWINRDYDRNPLSERRYRRVLARLVNRRTDLALDLLGRGDWDCALLNVTEPHFAAHAFFHHLRSAEPTRGRSRLGATTGLLDTYVETDRCVARLIDAAGPETDVIVFSTIGLRPNETSRDLLREVLIALGYEFPAPRAKARGGRATAMRLGTKLVPRFLRHRLRQLMSAEAFEEVADEAWGKSIDWSRSRAVSEAEPGSAWLRLNIAGREAEGIVDPADRDALIAEITADLTQLVDDETGEPAVAEVASVAAIAPGELSGQMPDLLVHWTPNQRIRTVRHPRVGRISDRRGPYARTEHTSNGFLVAAGPSISTEGPPHGSPTPSEVDIAPTVLHAYGAPVPEGMTGEVLEWLLAERRDVRRADIDISATPSL
jgi:predicted AlkP superfamily phosphohydrolase/phosphomutase